MPPSPRRQPQSTAFGARGLRARLGPSCRLPGPCAPKTSSAQLPPEPRVLNGSVPPNARTLSGVTRRRRVRGQARRPVARSLWIETFEGSRPEFGRAIAYWGFNRNSATKCGNFATQRMIGHIAVRPPIGNIAVALPNGTTGKRPPRGRPRSNADVDGMAAVDGRQSGAEARFYWRRVRARYGSRPQVPWIFLIALPNSYWQSAWP